MGGDEWAVVVRVVLWLDAGATSVWDYCGRRGTLRGGHDDARTDPLCLPH